MGRDNRSLPANRGEGGTAVAVVSMAAVVAGVVKVYGRKADALAFPEVMVVVAAAVVASRRPREGERRGRQGGAGGSPAPRDEGPPDCSKIVTEAACCAELAWMCGPAAAAVDAAINAAVSAAGGDGGGGGGDGGGSDGGSDWRCVL